MNSIGPIITGYSTKEALQEKGTRQVTKDHLNAPRRMCDMILWKPELLYDVEKFNEVVRYARFTINVTKQQNSMVKQKKDGTIHNLSVETYKTITKLWAEKGKGYTTEFPEHLTYPTLTEYERTLL
jgi:hypothetical protein